MPPTCSSHKSQTRNSIPSIPSTIAVTAILLFEYCTKLVLWVCEQNFHSFSVSNVSISLHSLPPIIAVDLVEFFKPGQTFKTLCLKGFLLPGFASRGFNLKIYILSKHLSNKFLLPLIISIFLSIIFIQFRLQKFASSFPSLPRLFVYHQERQISIMEKVINIPGLCIVLV